MRQINSIIKIALWLFIIRNAIGVFQLLLSIGFSDISLSVFSIIQAIIMIVILSNMLRVKTWSLYAFYIFQVLNVILLTLIEDGNSMYDLRKHSFVAIIICAIMSAILFIRKNGISAWKVFLSNESTFDDVLQAQLDAREESANVQPEVSNASDYQLENEGIAPVDESTQEQKPTIPIDEKGNILYHKAPIEATISDLTDGTLDDNEIDGFISANKAEAEKLLKKISDATPKIGTNKVKYLADKKAWQEKVADVQAQVDYWNEVEGIIKTLSEKGKTLERDSEKVDAYSKFPIIALIFVFCILAIALILNVVNSNMPVNSNKYLSTNQLYEDSIRKSDSIAAEVAAAEAALEASGLSSEDENNINENDDEYDVSIDDEFQ